MIFRIQYHIQFILTLFNYYKDDYKILINFQFVAITLLKLKKQSFITLIYFNIFIIMFNIEQTFHTLFTLKG